LRLPQAEVLANGYYFVAVRKKGAGVPGGEPPVRTYHETGHAALV